MKQHPFIIWFADDRGLNCWEARQMWSLNRNEQGRSEGETLLTAKSNSVSNSPLVLGG